MFNGYRITAWDEGKVLEMDDSDGCITIKMFLMALSCMVKNGYGGYSPYMWNLKSIANELIFKTETDSQT